MKVVLTKQKKLKTNQILLGNGSDEVLDLLFRAFCEPKVDNVITLPPTYGMYGVLANINAVENKEILLSTDFQPQIENFALCWRSLPISRPKKCHPEQLTTPS